MAISSPGVELDKFGRSEGVRTTAVAMERHISPIRDIKSHWEGLSLSSVEGMASGRPFVASDVDGLREVVDGAGVLFPHGDHEALAHSIQELCENPELYKQVAQRCQERAKQFDISIMAEKYNQLCQNLIR